MKKIILTGCSAIVFAVAAKDVYSGCSAANAYSRLWNAEIQAQIDERIEKHRKADGEFVVSAPDGVDVKVEQVAHAFSAVE